MNTAVTLGIRWTIGDASDRGYEALRLSLWGAWKLFKTDAIYTVCVNTIPVTEARERAGEVPPAVVWRETTAADVPGFLRPHLDRVMAEGVAWKLSPLRVHPDRYELALDNDCILWDVPAAIRTWLDGRHGHYVVFAEDAKRALGKFDELCSPEPQNSGIRGLPPDVDYEKELTGTLAERPVKLTSELDEQGLQAAALRRAAPLLLVSTEDVSICSPFPSYQSGLGRCGAHFVGLNARSLPWKYENQPATDLIAEHWRRHRPDLYRRVGLA